MGIAATLGNRFPGFRNSARDRMLGRLVNTAVASPAAPRDRLTKTHAASVVKPADVKDVVVRSFIPVAYKDRHLDLPLIAAEADDVAAQLDARTDDDVHVEAAESPLFFRPIDQGGRGLLEAIDVAKRARATMTGIPPEEQAVLGIIDTSVAAHNLDHVSYAGMQNGMFRMTDVQPHGDQMTQWVGYDLSKPLN